MIVNKKEYITSLQGEKLMKSKDIYDTIIEKCTKDWYHSMLIDLNKFWIAPKFSKKQIDKAGKTIASSDSSADEQQKALEILNNWRSSHAYPLQVITSNLRRNNPNAIVVQRLKRLDSITGKLKRFPQMSLYRMQDLGGCRVIVNSIDEVYNSINKYKTSRIRHILKRENDYIQNPKDSGYRSYHMIYQFHSDDKETYNKNMLIEIQIRTQLQHIWATALETMGIYTKTALKASIGDKDILRFFTLVSSVFAKIENMPICPNTSNSYDELISEIREIDSKLNIVSRLSALSVAIKQTNENYSKGKGYYLLQLNLSKRLLKINKFSTTQIELATNIYDKIESLNNPYMDAVLVSAASFENLKAAYPNYFTDISQFINTIQQILK